MPADFQLSHYLSDEEAAWRIARLIERIALEGLRPGESVPPRIMVLADFRRGEMRVAS